METSSGHPRNETLLSRCIAAIDPGMLSLNLLAGWIAWVAIIVTGGLLQQKAALSGYELLNYMDHEWETAFFLSIPVVFIAGIIHVIRQHRPWHVALSTVLLYAGPISLSHIAFTLLDSLYKGYGPAKATWQSLGLITILFYLGGIAYLAVKARRKDDQAIAAFLVPPYVIAILAGVLAFIQVLTSADYRYRNAFDLTVQSSETKDGRVNISGTFHVKKPASYLFSVIGTAPCYLSDEDIDSTTLSWKTVPPSAVGDYLFSVSCKVKPLATEPNPGTADYPMLSDVDIGPRAYLQISIASEKEGSAPQFVKSLPISTWEIYP